MCVYTCVLQDARELHSSRSVQLWLHPPRWHVEGLTFVTYQQSEKQINKIEICTEALILLVRSGVVKQESSILTADLSDLKAQP